MKILTEKRIVTKIFFSPVVNTSKKIRSYVNHSQKSGPMINSFHFTVSKINNL
jgi:hypothetical protein